MTDFSTKKITRDLLDEIKQVLRGIEGWGSVEIFVQDNRVVQITARKIRKTNHDLKTVK